MKILDNRKSVSVWPLQLQGQKSNIWWLPGESYFQNKNSGDDDDDDADDDDDDDDDDEDEDYRDQLSNFWWHPVSVCSVRRLLVPYDKGDIWVNCIFCKLNIKSFVCASQRAEATWLLASNEKGQLITVFNELMHLADFDDDN